MAFYRAIIFDFDNDSRKRFLGMHHTNNRGVFDHIAAAQTEKWWGDLLQGLVQEIRSQTPFITLSDVQIRMEIVGASLYNIKRSFISKANFC